VNSENFTPDPEEQQPSEAQPRAGRARSIVLRTVVMIVFGAALLLLVMSMTILRNDEPASSHGPIGSIAPLTPAAAATTESVSTTASVVTTAVAVQLSPFEQAQAAGGYLTAAASLDQLKIYDRVPPGSQLMLIFPREGKKQISSTFLVTGEDEDDQGRFWYQIRLPIRPNGSTGWVKATDVTVSTVMYSMSIDLSDHQLDLYEAGRLKKSYPVGVGTDDNPTPPGDYYITIKMKPTTPNGVYGVLAMGVSGFSEKLTSWPEGGQLGIHGTNDPSSVGRDVSHGCIRLYNEDILDLSQYVAYGTPVSIQD
jgi:lipoprotein-anchoring transpeptidase ErfK/SrfK